MKILEITDKYYPEQLKNIKRPPKKLYVLGDETILNNKGIAIVGSRCCTEYGEKAATFLLATACLVFVIFYICLLGMLERKSRAFTSFFQHFDNI